MEEGYLYKVNVKLGTWIDVRMEQEFFVSPKQDSASEAESLAEQVIEEKWGHEWEVLDFKITDCIGKVYKDKKECFVL